jgi:hypothetical protein
LKRPFRFHFVEVSVADVHAPPFFASFTFPFLFVLLRIFLIILFQDAVAVLSFFAPTSVGRSVVEFARSLARSGSCPVLFVLLARTSRAPPLLSFIFGLLSSLTKLSVINL